MTVAGLSCEAAASLIAELPAGPFQTEQRLEISGFRCGTEGMTGATSNVVECAQKEQRVDYIATY